MNSSNKSLKNKFHAHCPTQAELHDYVAQLVNPSLITEIENKLNNCGEDACLCSEVIEGLELEKIALQIKKNEPELIQGFDAQRVYQNIKPLLEKNPPQPIQKKLPNRSLSMSYALGAAAVISLFLLIIWWNNLKTPVALVENNPPQKLEKEIKSNSQTSDNQVIEEKNVKTEIPKSDDKNKQTPETNQSLAFAENPSLESDLAARARGSEELQLVSPQNNENFTQALKLAWQGLSNRTFEVEILDNQRRRMSLQTLPKGQTELRLEVKDWQAGLYYWRLSDENDLLYTGKFTVKK
ncbi:MAG: hypothetical protein MUE85_03530 [Microscillaceae bacterium]|jgi:hypothetical protein|nr:hypothetical protein [Microscillaceae bacterium]